MFRYIIKDSVSNYPDLFDKQCSNEDHHMKWGRIFCMFYRHFLMYNSLTRHLLQIRGTQGITFSHNNPVYPVCHNPL